MRLMNQQGPWLQYLHQQRPVIMHEQQPHSQHLDRHIAEWCQVHAKDHVSQFSLITAFPMTLRTTSPISIGRTPGHL